MAKCGDQKVAILASHLVDMYEVDHGLLHTENMIDLYKGRLMIDDRLVFVVNPDKLLSLI